MKQFRADHLQQLATREKFGQITCGPEPLHPPHRPLPIVKRFAGVAARFATLFPENLENHNDVIGSAYFTHTLISRSS